MEKIEKIKERVFQSAQEKAYAMGQIADFVSQLNSLIKAQYTEYKIVGKEQVTKWIDGESVPQWEDEEETIPKMRDKWIDVEVDAVEGDKLDKVNAYKGLAEILTNIF